MKLHWWLQHGVPWEVLGRMPLHPSAALSPAYINTHLFHGLRKSPITSGSRCSVGIVSAVSQH